ncbi:MAG: hypothetical protein WC054_08095 [Candidatus Nanopelagicales bacterium]
MIAILGGIVFIAVVAGSDSSQGKPTAYTSQALLDYYSASGITRTALCNDIESGATFDGWQEQTSGQTGLSAREVEAQTYAWCGLSQ